MTPIPMWRQPVVRRLLWRQPALLLEAPLAIILASEQHLDALGIGRAIGALDSFPGLQHDPLGGCGAGVEPLAGEFLGHHETPDGDHIMGMLLLRESANDHRVSGLPGG
ncbi:MAG: hypothetical protein P8Z78_07670 [Gammaproteobacteria bacterium]|jgi:hypothetical protein